MIELEALVADDLNEESNENNLISKVTANVKIGDLSKKKLVRVESGSSSSGDSFNERQGNIRRNHLDYKIIVKEK